MVFDWNSILSNLMVVLQPVVLTIFGIVSAKVIQLINTKVKNAKTKEILDRLMNFIYHSAMLTEVKVVNELKKNGPLNKEGQQKALQTTLDSVKQMMGPAGMTDLQKVLGIDQAAVEHVVVAKIESTVATIGQQQNSQLPRS